MYFLAQLCGMAIALTGYYLAGIFVFSAIGAGLSYTAADKSASVIMAILWPITIPLVVLWFLWMLLYEFVRDHY